MTQATKDSDLLAKQIGTTERQSKYADSPPKLYGNWRDSFGVRTINTSSTPGLVLIEVKVAKHAFQLYPNEFSWLKAAMNDYPFTEAK